MPAGVEVGVASTKAFTTQLAGLFLLTLALAHAKGRLTEAQEAAHLKAMRHLPAALSAVLVLGIERAKLRESCLVPA
jgi:glucosamine--fructose-6-phosphate aminotransferase (isomerizing)